MKGAPKLRGHSKHRPKKLVTVGEHTFDSETEARYFIKLSNDPSVKEIVLQPQFTIVPEYLYRCIRCKGIGLVPSPKTDKPIKCGLCKGEGKRKSGKSVYTADFQVTYVNGYVEVIDVKGKDKKADNETFPLRKQLFQYYTGMELVIERFIPGKGWQRDKT